MWEEAIVVVLRWEVLKCKMKRVCGAARLLQSERVYMGNESTRKQHRSGERVTQVELYK